MARAASRRAAGKRGSRRSWRGTRLFRADRARRTRGAPPVRRRSGPGLFDTKRSERRAAALPSAKSLLNRRALLPSLACRAGVVRSGAIGTGKAAESAARISIRIAVLRPAVWTRIAAEEALAAGRDTRRRSGVAPRARGHDRQGRNPDHRCQPPQRHVMTPRARPGRARATASTRRRTPTDRRFVRPASRTRGRRRPRRRPRASL